MPALLIRWQLWAILIVQLSGKLFFSLTLSSASLVFYMITKYFVQDTTFVQLYPGLPMWIFDLILRQSAQPDPLLNFSLEVTGLFVFSSAFRSPNESGVRSTE